MATIKRTEQPVPAWAERLAHLMPLVGLPVCLWRLPIGFGFQMGMNSNDPQPDSLWFTVYVFALSVLSEAFALACLGLVRWWGETVPQWVPFAGGRRIPPMLVIVPATVAGLLFVGLLVEDLLSVFEIGGFATVPYDNGWWRLLANVVSGLFLLWGPMVLAMTWAYYRRRCHGPVAATQ
ncbi:hypothetical protein [Streptomyces cinnamoneus]|uniref:Uncharacterized protein n=1 Tax=Streptomyces cinnamoneus TaxID=53446 RepID=A0A918TYI0_STRCJ|nr:hypothetical protein [Streptomyces cinnamoneus]GHC70027.1 hypothetical protein GCM10010507_55910 [Streptomyces cinnamoneus]